MPFELRNPSGLWLLSLLAPLILLYVLKIRRERLRISSTWLWLGAQRDLMARQPFRRLIVQVPLIVQILALALCALALARPAKRGSVIPGNHFAIVIDTSASMAAQDAAGVSRIAEARVAAKHVLASLAPGSDALLIEAGREPRMASTPDHDIKRLEAAVDHIDARDVEGNLARALGFASDRLQKLAAGPGSLKRIIVITDAAVADRSAISASALPVEILRVGSASDNTGIVRIDVRRGTDPVTKREQVQVFSLVTHYGSKPRDVFITLRQRNVTEPLASRRLRLAPAERVPVVLTFQPTRGDAGTGLVVELSPNDALRTDDRAYGRVPAGRAVTVVLAPSDGNAWVKRALQADPDVELVGAALGALGSAGVPDDALLVVDGACPPELPGADVLLLNPPPGRCESVVVGKPIEHVRVTSWTESDPRLRFLMLDGVDIAKAHSLELDGAGHGLMRARDGVLMADVSTPNRTATLVGFDVGDSNWPLKASFVLFMRNIVELSRAHRAHGALESSHTGEPLRLRVPSDVSIVSLESPDGRVSKVPARSSMAVLPDTTRAGFYYASWQGARPGSLLVASNLASEAESDIRPKELAVGSSSARVTNRGPLDMLTDFTWLFAALALSFLVFDVWWWTRRRTPTARLDNRKPRLPERAASRSAA